MKFDGKQLFALGCPQNKIKFFVGKEFNSQEDLVAAFSQQAEKKESEELSPDSAFNFLLSLSHLPVSTEGRDFNSPSKSEVRRWLLNGAVSINGFRPKPEDIISLPITQLVFFSNSKRKTTMV